MKPLFSLLFLPVFVLGGGSGGGGGLGGVDWRGAAWTLADQFRVLFALAFWASAAGLLLYGVLSLIGPTKHVRLSALHDALEHVRHVLLGVFAVTAAAAGGVALMPQVASVFTQNAKVDASILNYLLVDPVVNATAGILDIKKSAGASLSGALRESLWGVGVFTAMAAYAGVMWLTGVRRFREEGAEVLLRAVVGLVLYTAALLIGVASLAFADDYVNKANITRVCFTSADKVLGAGLADAPAQYQQWLVNTSRCATNVFGNYTSAARDTLVDLLTGVAYVGILPFVNTIAMSFMQILMYLITGITSLTAAAVSAAVSATAAASLAGLSVMALAAVAVMHEKTRLLGSVVLGTLAAAPVLVVAADAAYNALKPEDARVTGWHNIVVTPLWGFAVAKTYDMMKVSALLVLALALYALAAYAASRIFDHAGGALAAE